MSPRMTRATKFIKITEDIRDDVEIYVEKM